MTVHQLIGRARFAIERYTKSLADFPDQSGVAMDLELARIALAALTTTQPLSDAERAELQDRRKADSEPVMYQARMWNPEYEEWDPWAECNENAFVVFSHEADRGEGMEVRKLYAAPQPAPVVPDAATAIRACLSEFPEGVRDIVEECADIAENACRAAMLNGGES